MRDARFSFYFPAASIPECIGKQSVILFGDMKANTKHIPLLLLVIFTHLRQQLEAEKISPKQIIYSFFDLNQPEAFATKWSQIKPQMAELKVD